MVSDAAETRIDQLVERAFGPNRVEIGGLTDVNQGRGAFSLVLRVDLRWSDRSAGSDAAGAGRSTEPTSVVAKLPIPGPNGAAAAASGAYRRESLAYREILGRTPVRHPKPWAVLDEGATCSLLLEDLTGHRAVDQIDGLGRTDALAVARSLAGLHQAWDGQVGQLAGAVRRNTVASLPADGLDAGLRILDSRWSEVLSPDDRAVFAELRGARDGLAERFDAEPVTLCHGDPRADNLAFTAAGEAFLFDWQQMAVQFGEADLAWLAATSLTVEDRRAIEHDLVEAGEGRHDRYRLGLALPGLAVLFLAQRELVNERAERFVATSLQRIAAAVADNDTAALAKV